MEQNKQEQTTGEATSGNTGFRISMMRMAFMFPGVLMGAGFASGKEMWQFFSIFGGKGVAGVAVAVFMFILCGFFVVTIGRIKQTDDLGKLICPVENKILQNGVAIVMALFLYTAYFSMLAAAGAVFEEQLKLPKIPLEAVFMIVVILTAIKGFQKVSSRLGMAAPVLIGVTMILAVTALIRNGGQFQWKPVVDAGTMNTNWVLSAFLFVSYNMVAATSILGSGSLHTKDLKTAQWGAVLGGVFVSINVLLLTLVNLTDPQMANDASLPMLAFCQRLSPVLGIVYSCVLLISMFGTATSCFYGMANKIPAFAGKNKLLWGLALVGFGCSLAGFKNLVAYVYPAEGYISLLFTALLIINFIKTKRGETTCLNNSLKE